MQISRLSNWVTFERPEGFSALSYTPIRRVPVALEMVSGGGSEVLRFGAPAATGYFKITMRYWPAVKAEWRIVHDDGRVFQISSYGDPDGSRQVTEIFVTETQ